MDFSLALGGAIVLIGGAATTFLVQRQRHNKTVAEAIALIQLLVRADQTGQRELYDATKDRLATLHQKRPHWVAEGFTYVYMEIFADYNAAKTVHDNAQSWPGTPRTERSQAHETLTIQTRRYETFLALNDVFTQAILTPSKTARSTS